MNPKERERVLGPPLQEGTPKVKAARKVRVLQESLRATLSRKANIQIKKPVIIGIHLSALFMEKRRCTLGNKCALQNTEKAEGEPKNGKNSVAIAVPPDFTKAEVEIASQKFKAKGDLLHCVSANPANRASRKVLSKSATDTLGIVQHSGQNMVEV